MQNLDLLKQLENAFTEEKDVYEKILSLSKAQLDLLAEKKRDTDRIARLMNEKWQRIQQAQALEQSHQPIKSTWEEVHASFNEDERKPAAEAKQALMGLLEELQRLEEEITVGIRGEMSEINQQLLNLQKEKNSAKAYYSNIDFRPPRYIDKTK